MKDRWNSGPTQAQDAIDELESAMDHAAKNLKAEARHACDVILPAMNAVRAVADELEVIVANDLWPLPTYQEILFIK